MCEESKEQSAYSRGRGRAAQPLDEEQSDITSFSGMRGSGGKPGKRNQEPGGGGVSDRKSDTAERAGSGHSQKLTQSREKGTKLFGGEDAD